MRSMVESRRFQERYIQRFSRLLSNVTLSSCFGRTLGADIYIFRRHESLQITTLGLTGYAVTNRRLSYTGTVHTRHDGDVDPAYRTICFDYL